MLPPIPFSALDFWPLEAPPWSSLYGQSARASTNLNTASSWNYAGTCLSVDTNGPAYLREDCFQGAWSNIVFDSGSLSLFFLPNWTSVSDGGLGPTNWAALVSVGHWTSNASQSAWVIAIDSAGSNLVMEAQAGGSNQVVFNVPITYDAGTWHQIFITYSLTNCCVYLEGQPATNVAPINNYPSGADCTNFGMFFGSLSAAGDCQCHGQLQWLATYDYPLSTDEVAADYANVSSYITWWGGSLPGGGFHPADGAPAPPGGYGGGGGGGGGGSPPPPTPTYNTNDLYLTIAWTNSNQAVVVNLINTTNGTNYLLLASTNLLGPWVTNQSLPGAVGTNTWSYPIGILDATDLFFKAEKTNGPTNGTLKWVTNLSGLIASDRDVFGYGLDCSPAVSPLGPIYLTSGETNLIAVDPIFADVLWTNSPPDLPAFVGEFTGSAAVGPDGAIFAGFFDGDVHTFNVWGGTNWFSAAGSNAAVYATPALSASGLVIAPTDVRGGSSDIPAGVAGFNADGSTNWFFAPQDLFHFSYATVDGSPAIGADGTVYFVGEGYRLYALSPAGQLEWFFPLPSNAEPDPGVAIASDGSLVLASSDGTEDFHAGISLGPYLYCVNPDGSLKWIHYFADGPSATKIIPCEPALGPGGVIYCGSLTGGLASVNADGSTNWIFLGDDTYVCSTPVLAQDGTIYFGTTGGTFYALQTNGTPIWSTNIGAAIYSSPVIMPDCSVVVAGEDGNLYSFWGSSPLATNASWPMFQHDPAHTGQATPTTTLSTYCGAPFVFNGGNDGSGHFYFSMTGPPGSSNWNVYASTNLAETNWTQVGTNLVLDSVTGNAFFSDTNATNASKFYLVSQSNCCSKVIGYVSLSISARTNFTMTNPPPPGPSNLTNGSGMNLIADQVYQVDDGVLFQDGNFPMNTIVALFAISNAWNSAESGTEIYEWNGSGFIGDTNVGTVGPDWLGGGNMTLLPGSGAFMVNTTSNAFTIWFNGLVREQQTFRISPTGTNQFSTNYLSATVPEAGYITNITGYVPHNGDTIKL